jgi:threonine/homoserine/homoserine lactone efflux protein
MLIAAGAQRGVRGGLPCLLGVVAGMGLMMVLVPLGLGSLVLDRPLALAALRWGGSAFLLWLAWKIATSSGRIDTATGRSPVGFAGAAAFQWMNPKSWLVATSAAATFLDAGAGSPVLQAASFGLLFVLGAGPACLPWLVFGAALQRVLHGRRQRLFNVAMGGLLALSIALVVR